GAIAASVRNARWKERLANRIFRSSSSTRTGSRTVSTIICASERASSVSRTCFKEISLDYRRLIKETKQRLAATTRDRREPSAFSGVISARERVGPYPIQRKFPRRNAARAFFEES